MELILPADSEEANMPRNTLFANPQVVENSTAPRGRGVGGLIGHGIRKAFGIETAQTGLARTRDAAFQESIAKTELDAFNSAKGDPNFNFNASDPENQLVTFRNLEANLLDQGDIEGAQEARRLGNQFIPEPESKGFTQEILDVDGKKVLGNVNQDTGEFKRIDSQNLALERLKQQDKKAARISKKDAKRAGARQTVLSQISKGVPDDIFSVVDSFVESDLGLFPEGSQEENQAIESIKNQLADRAYSELLFRGLDNDAEGASIAKILNEIKPELENSITAKFDRGIFSDTESEFDPDAITNTIENSNVFKKFRENLNDRPESSSTSTTIQGLNAEQRNLLQGIKEDNPDATIEEILEDKEVKQALGI